MLDCEDAILVVLGVASGRVGRTALQKLVYFGREKQLVNASFQAHYFGPYSSEVSAALQSLVGLGWVDESVETWSLDDPIDARRRYTYRLTDVGKLAREQLINDEASAGTLEQIVRLGEQKANLDFRLLSLAAKVRFILTTAAQPGEALTTMEIRKRAEELGWNLTEQDIESIAELLETSDLAHRTQAHPV
jgi:uncharacterized protein YwgA